MPVSGFRTRVSVWYKVSMRWAPAILLAMSLIASSAVFEETELPEFDGHLGRVHVDGEAEGHHHGDEDDHHESPDSPCHHHEDQVCAGHAHDLGFTALTSILEPGIARLFKAVSIEPSDPHSIHRIWHIPIA